MLFEGVMAGGKQTIDLIFNSGLDLISLLTESYLELKQSGIQSLLRGTETPTEELCYPDSRYCSCHHIALVELFAAQSMFAENYTLG